MKNETTRWRRTHNPNKCAKFEIKSRTHFSRISACRIAFWQWPKLAAIPKLHGKHHQQSKKETKKRRRFATRSYSIRLNILVLFLWQLKFEIFKMSFLGALRLEKETLRLESNQSMVIYNWKKCANLCNCQNQVPFVETIITFIPMDVGSRLLAQLESPLHWFRLRMLIEAITLKWTKIDLIKSIACARRYIFRVPNAFSILCFIYIFFLFTYSQFTCISRGCTTKISFGLQIHWPKNFQMILVDRSKENRFTCNLSFII